MSRSSSISQLYLRLPSKMVRRTVGEYITRLDISTPNLRKLVATKDLDRDIKCRLYAFLLHRRHRSQRRRGAR